MRKCSECSRNCCWECTALTTIPGKGHLSNCTLCFDYECKNCGQELTDGHHYLDKYYFPTCDQCEAINSRVCTECKIVYIRDDIFVVMNDHMHIVPRVAIIFSVDGCDRGHYITKRELEAVEVTVKKWIHLYKFFTTLDLDGSSAHMDIFNNVVGHFS